MPLEQTGSQRESQFLSGRTSCVLSAKRGAGRVGGGRFLSLFSRTVRVDKFGRDEWGDRLGLKAEVKERGVG